MLGIRTNHISGMTPCNRTHVDINTLRPRKDGRPFPDEIFKSIFFNKNVQILIKISLTFVPKAVINNIPALVQMMAWRRPGDKSLSEQMMVSLLTHICVTRPQWVKLTYPHEVNAKDIGAMPNAETCFLNPVLYMKSINYMQANYFHPFGHLNVGIFVIFYNSTLNRQARNMLSKVLYMTMAADALARCIARLSTTIISVISRFFPQSKISTTRPIKT